MLLRPWGWSHQREKLSQQGCRTATMATATTALLTAVICSCTHLGMAVYAHAYTHGHMNTQAQDAREV